MQKYLCQHTHLHVHTVYISVFQVANPGQALNTLGSAFLNIMWPHELANGKWLLYPSSLKFEGHPNTLCTPKGFLNPLKLQSSSPTEPPPNVTETVSGAVDVLLWREICSNSNSTQSISTYRYKDSYFYYPQKLQDLFGSPEMKKYQL